MPWPIHFPSCADSGAKCPGKFVTETQKELLDHVKLHMAASHPDR